MIRETIFLGHDNTLDWRLTEEGVAIDIGTATKVELLVNGITFSSEDHGGSGADNPFYWTVGVPAVGQANLFLRLGIIFEAAEIPKGTYRGCRLIVYDPSNTNGILWDNAISFIVK